MRTNLDRLSLPLPSQPGNRQKELWPAEKNRWASTAAVTATISRCFIRQYRARNDSLYVSTGYLCLQNSSRSTTRLSEVWPSSHWDRLLRPLISRRIGFPYYAPFSIILVSTSEMSPEDEWGSHVASVGWPSWADRNWTERSSWLSAATEKGRGPRKMLTRMSPNKFHTSPVMKLRCCWKEDIF